MVAVKIKHSLSPIRVTTGHPFFSIRGVPMEQDCARTMQWLDKGKVQAEWVDAGELRRGDYVAQVIPTQVIPVEGFSEDDAGIYGILLGDGHLSKNGRQWGVSGNPQLRRPHRFVRQYLAERGIHYWETGRGETYLQVHWASGRGVVRDGTTGRIAGAGAATMPFGYDDIYDARGKEAHLAPVLPPSTRAHAGPDPGPPGDRRRRFPRQGNILHQHVAAARRGTSLPIPAPWDSYGRAVPQAGTSHVGRRSDGSTIKFSGFSDCYDVRIPAVMEIAALVGLQAAHEEEIGSPTTAASIRGLEMWRASSPTPSSSISRWRETRPT